MNIDSIMKELAEYIRIDTTALKRELPCVAAQYTRSTETRRFTFS